MATKATNPPAAAHFDNVQVTTAHAATPKVLAKRLHRPQQAATAGVHMAPPSQPNQDKVVVKMTAANAPTITATTGKPAKKRSHRSNRKRLARSFVMADVPMLDSPEWSSEDEIDNPRFNREFRQRHNEQLRKLLKENEARARMAAEAAAAASSSAGASAAPPSKPAQATTSQTAVNTASVPARTAQTAAEEPTQRTGTAPAAVGGLATSPRKAEAEDHSLGIVSPASSSFVYDSDDTQSAWQEHPSFDEDFFFGGYGSDSTYSADTTASSSNSATTSADATPSTPVLEGNVSGGSPQRARAYPSPVTLARHEEVPRAAKLTGPRRREVKPPPQDSTRSLHATFAPNTVSPTTLPHALPTAANSTTMALASTSPTASPFQTMLYDDLLSLTESVERTTRRQQSSADSANAAARAQGAESTSVAGTVSATARVAPEAPNHTRWRPFADETASPALSLRGNTTTSAAAGLPPSILAQSRSTRRAGEPPSTISKFLATTRRVGEEEASRGTDSAPSDPSRLARQSSKTSLVQDAREVRGLLLSLTSPDDDEYADNDTRDTDLFDFRFTESGSGLLGRVASDMDGYLLSCQSSAATHPLQPSREPSMRAAPRGSSANRYPLTANAAKPSPRADSPVSAASFVLAGTLGRNGRLAATAEAPPAWAPPQVFSLSGDDADGIEYWELPGAPHPSGHSRSLLAKASSLRRRDSQTILQSARKNANYFGSINPFSYHSARLASTRRASQAATQSGMLRMYSIVRSARRTHNAPTVAITEPTAGGAAAAGPYTAATTRPSQASVALSSLSDHTDTLYSQPQYAMDSGETVSRRAGVSQLAPHAVAAARPPPCPPVATRRLSTEPTNAPVANTASLPKSVDVTLDSYTSQPVSTLGHPVLSGPRHVGANGLTTTAPSSAVTPAMKDVPLFTSAPAIPEGSSLLARRPSAAAPRGTYPAPESATRRHSLPVTAAELSGSHRQPADPETRIQSKFDLFNSSFGGTLTWADM